MLTILLERGHFMSTCVNWVALRLAFLVGFAVFVLAMFAVLPGIFLFVGFTIYSIAVPFWLFPKERLFPSDEYNATTRTSLDPRTVQAPPAKPREARAAPTAPRTNIVPSHWLSRFHLPRQKA